MFQINEFRSHFPQLDRKIGSQSLIYFDNAATSLKPKMMIDAISDYYSHDVANIHRGAHTLSRLGTERFEHVRAQVQKFIGASSSQEVIFTRGVTEAMNLLSYAYGFDQVGIGDVIVLTPFEHHSNIIPWKILSENTGCQIELLPFNQKGQVSQTELDKIFQKKVKMVSMTLYSNVTGVRLDVESVIKRARAHGALTIIDAAQAMLHEKINVQKLDCDFLSFSAHKMFGPTGAGVLYGKAEHLKSLPPFMGGGSMISSVTWEKTVYQDSPYKFEAGTPSIADVFGLGKAIEFIEGYGVDAWKPHLQSLVQQLESALSENKKIKLISPRRDEAQKADIISFVYEGYHPSDIGELLDQKGIAVRAGHHCAQPLMESLKIPGTVRISLAPYNSEQEVNAFIKHFAKIEELL